MKIHKYKQDTGNILELEILGEEVYVRILEVDGSELGEVMMDKDDILDLREVLYKVAYSNTK